MTNSATISETKLYKRCNIVSFHFVRNFIIAKYFNFHQLKSEFNITAIPSKHWQYQSVYNALLKLIFHFEVDTGHLFENNLLYAM